MMASYVSLVRVKVTYLDFFIPWTKQSSPNITSLLLLLFLHIDSPSTTTINHPLLPLLLLTPTPANSESYPIYQIPMPHSKLTSPSDTHPQSHRPRPRRSRQRHRRPRRASAPLLWQIRLRRHQPQRYQEARRRQSQLVSQIIIPISHTTTISISISISIYSLPISPLTPYPNPTLSSILTILTKRGIPIHSDLIDLPISHFNPKRRSNSNQFTTLPQARRRSSVVSVTNPAYTALKTKFESADPNEVVEYDEYVHGPSEQDGAELEKMSTGSSAGTLEEEEEGKEVK